MKEAKPWLLDVIEAKSNVRDQITALQTRHDRVALKLTKMNVTVEAIGAKVEDNGKNIRSNMDRVEEMSDSSRALGARLENISTLIHERIDSVVNRSRDMSVAHEDHQANIYQVRRGFILRLSHISLSQMISDLEYKQEVMEEEGEETRLATDLSLQRLQTEVVKLEAALNMTVSQWADLKSGHTEFAKKTLAILSNMMELAHTTTERSGQTLQDLEVTNQQDESSTKSPLKSSNCTKVVKIPSWEITCEASSEFHKRFGCKKAFDGQLSVGKQKNSWASKGEGVGAWIKASFSSKKSVSQLKLLQRHYPGEANKKVELEFSPGVRQLATLPAKGDTHWNIIKLSRNVGADYVKITIKEVYGTVNNGFKEIEIYGCDYSN